MMIVECVDVGLKIGMNRRDVMILTTPGELQDLLQMRSNREYERKLEYERGKKREQF